jgi:uncharacterized protein (DUF1330 family)
MSAIKPTMEQFAALAAAAKTNDGTVVMLNLLKFHAGEGAKEYGAYGGIASKMVNALGGRIIYVGRCDQILIGNEDANDWDAIAVVEYPNRQAFIDMVSKPDYQKASEHRDAGLERTMLIATTPTSAIG